MSAPRNGDWAAVKRVVRYLMGKPRLVWRFAGQAEPKFLSAFSDSNWAGCHDTRKSTSGACIMHGGHLVKAYSRTQSNIALSSGEAEFYALVAAASEALGMAAMTEDFGSRLAAYLYADASAAIGVANREGLGRIRHLDTQSLWLQQALRKKRLGVSKVPGAENPSDLMTKHVDAKLLGEHARSMGCEFLEGRAELAPQVVQQVDDHNDHDDDDTVNAVEDDDDAITVAEDAPVGTAAGDIMAKFGDVDSDGIIGVGDAELVIDESPHSCIYDKLPSGLMTVSATEGRQPSTKIHCAIVAGLCLQGSCSSHRLTRRCCRDGGRARGSAQSQRVQRSRPRIRTKFSADEIPHCTVADEHLSGHPCLFHFCRVWRSRSRGGACFHTIWTHRLSTHASGHAEHLRTCRCMLCTCRSSTRLVFP